MGIRIGHIKFMTKNQIKDNGNLPEDIIYVVTFRIDKIEKEDEPTYIGKIYKDEKVNEYVFQPTEIYNLLEDTIGIVYEFLKMINSGKIEFNGSTLQKV